MCLFLFLFVACVTLNGICGQGIVCVCAVLVWLYFLRAVFILFVTTDVLCEGGDLAGGVQYRSFD